MKITAAIALLFGKASAAEPPANGNFFYIDFPDLQKTTRGHGQHEVQMKVQSKASPGRFLTYPLFVTTQESTIGLFSLYCKDCTAKTKFLPGDAVGYKAGKNTGVTEWVNVYDKTDSELQALNFEGTYSTTGFQFGLDFFKRDTVLHQEFLEITGVQKDAKHKPFDTDFSGYLGIAPWTADPDRKEQNFLWQLKDQGLINHMTMSFFVHLDDASHPDSPSTIKFGGWDPLNVDPRSPIKFIRTFKDNKTWDMKVNQLKLDDTDQGKFRFTGRIRMDPALPYLYVPQDVYDTFTTYMNTKYGSKTCLPEINICRFQKKCSEMKSTFGKSQDFEFRIHDVLKDYPFKIRTEAMMVDGKWFSDAPDTCYIPIFNHGLTRTDEDKQTIWVGNVFMQDYYVVYDMSNYDEAKGKGYLQVGLGRQASVNRGLAKIYDRSSSDYGPGAAKEADQSVIRDGECDQYDNDCNDPHAEAPTDLLTTDEMLQLATAAVAAGQSKTSFVNAMVVKADKYRSLKTFATIQGQYRDMAGQVFETAKSQADLKRQQDLQKEIQATFKMKEDARKAVAQGMSKKLFVADQMSKKHPSKDAEDLLKDAEQAYDAATDEVAAFDKDVEYLAKAQFELMHTVDDFIVSLKAKYPNIDNDHIEWQAKEAWKRARLKIQEEIQDKMKKAEADQLKMTELRNEARKAAEAGVKKEDWKKQKLQNISDYEDEKVAERLFDEAWLAAQREIAAVAAAKDAMGRGGDEKSYVDDMTKNKDPTDGRNVGEFLNDLTKAWTEALEQIKDKLQEEKNRSDEDNKLITRMIQEAREAIPRGTTIEKFADDQLWNKPAGKSEADIKEKATNAYRVAEMQLRTERKIAEEKAEEEELLKTAWLSVTIGQAERAFVDQRVAEWRMHPDLKNMTQDQETTLRQHAALAWNRAYGIWKDQQREIEEGTRKDVDEKLPDIPKKDDEESGGSGFVTFIVVVIILAILGGIAYFLHKMHKGKEQSYSFVKYGQGQNITVDGLMDLNENNNSQKILPHERSHDESMDEEVNKNSYAIQ